jgi:hypothetical protein
MVWRTIQPRQVVPSGLNPNYALSLTTNSNVVTVVQSIPIDLRTTNDIGIRVVGLSATGLVTLQDVVTRYYRVAGVPTKSGDVVESACNLVQVGTGYSLAVSGGNLNVRITGAAAIVVNWRVFIWLSRTPLP